VEKLIKHIKENWTKYGLETLVVIIGILVAFTLNNWNESRKAKNVGQSHLLELKAELLYDLERWEEHLIQFNQVDEAGLYVYDFLSGSSTRIDTAALNEAYWRAGHLAVFGITDVAYTNLIGSGAIENISDDELKRKLAFLHNDQRWDKRFHDGSMQQIFNEYNKFIHKHAEPLLIRNYFEKEFKGELEGIKERSRAITNDGVRWEEIKIDEEYLILLDRVMSNRVIQRLNYVDWKREMIELISLIDAELQ
jgi:hypothetical protein